MSGSRSPGKLRSAIPIVPISDLRVGPTTEADISGVAKFILYSYKDKPKLR